MDIILIGLLASVLAGLATGVGALPIFFWPRGPGKILDIMLGFAAGVMLAAAVFCLIVPALDPEAIPGGGLLVVVIGILAGALFLHALDKLIPHQHLVHKDCVDMVAARRAWLFVLAIAIHNFPEGLAVGLGFAAGPDTGRGIALAIGIGLQNIPEGLAVAIPLLLVGYSRGQALLIATITGLVEPVGALLAVTLGSTFEPILPIGLAFAGGAMIFVVVDEIIRETHRRGVGRLASGTLMIGFVVMMTLDHLLG